jgi:hypothetical protein
MAFPEFGAGFRFSLYGSDYNPGPAYWALVTKEMTRKFPGSDPMGIRIISKIEGNKAYLNFPGTSDDPNIVFGETDDNEASLTYHDKHNVQVWLQIEPGNVDMFTLVDLVLNRYGKHSCVIGFGVDVEWYHSKGDEAGATPVTDAEAAAWVDAIRAHNPEYHLLLKHWDISFMPPNARESILFVDDSQHFTSLDQMVSEFTTWGKTFAPVPVGFQVGYEDDRFWWSAMQDPPSDIGNAILSAVPNTAALFWVDFTVQDVFHPK